MTSPQEEMAAVARRRYFPAVEGMRAIAALAVLGGHVLVITHPQGGNLAVLGQRLAPMGVIVFFVISGFLIYRPFIAARGHGRSVGAIAPNFLLRRAVRIFPAYWVALTALAIWPGLTGVFSGHWYAYYGLLQLYAPHTWGLEGLGTAWTLCVEVTFYLSLPLVALLLQTRGAHSGRERALAWELGTIGALALLSLAWRTYFFPDFDTEFLGLALPGTFSWFCAGMLLAAIQMTPTALSRARAVLGNPAICWPLAAILFALLLREPIRPAEAFSHPWIAMETMQVTAIAALVVAPAVLGDRRRVVRLAVSNRAMIFLGTVSYGLYLWHLPLVEWLLTTSFIQESPSVTVTELVVGFAMTLTMATLSWYLIEKPLMKMVRSVKAIADPTGRRRRRTVEREPAPAAAIAEPAP